MMKKLLHHLSPATHMVTKIWVFSVTVVIVTILILTLLLNLLMRQSWLDQAIAQTQTNTAVTSIAVGDSYSQTMMRFVEICSTDAFQKLFTRIISGTPEEQTQLNNEAQGTLQALVNQSSMIRSAVLMNRHGLCLRPLSKAVDTNALTYSLGYGPEAFTGVTLLPRQSSPVRGLQDVIPMAIPLHTLPGTNMVSIADGFQDSFVMLYLFVDAEGINALLHTYAAQGIYGRLYLVSGQGAILNHRLDAPLDHPEDRSLMAQVVTGAAASSSDAGITEISDCHAFWHRVGDTSFFVVNLVPTSALTSTLSRAAAQVPGIILACVLLISLATFITSRTITRPLRRLMGTVQAIEDGCYDKSMVLPQRDEIGQLSASIDSMYDTIQQQITEIRQERQAKDNAEIRLISEQINPHFLYNTLESINMEVYSNHPESASAMIQNLGEFLRIGLSFGSKTITVSRELEHVQAYVNIMNNRFNQRIVFTSTVDQCCMEREVLKIILQPLVENSIRHGFHLDSQAASLDDQFISVEIHETPGGGMTMEVIDNGVGIDVARAERMLHADPARQRHVGLNNVYQRLLMHYGPEARITFSSIPYFRNVVCIHLPPPPQA